MRSKLHTVQLRYKKVKHKFTLTAVTDLLVMNMS